MARKLTGQAAARILSDVEPEKSFFVVNGPVLRSIEDFCTALNSMNDIQFSYHRNKQKNDFYSWIIDVVGDVRLANEVARAKTKETTLKKVRQRLEYLKSVLGAKNEA